AGWLCKLAWHVARRAKDAEVLRRRREREAAAMTGENKDALANDWERLRPLLDAELNALPEKYRLPLVLHHLEGLSQDETAKLLDCNVGTVSSQLTRGRELLRRRLEA